MAHFLMAGMGRIGWFGRAIGMSRLAQWFHSRVRPIAA
jgi:hypothetical protein